MTHAHTHASRRGGPPGYGPRKTLTVRVAMDDLPLLERQARQSGYASVERWTVAMIYEAVGLNAPAWAGATQTGKR